MKAKKPIVIITYATRWSYFQWFLLGLYELEKAGKIKLRFKLSPTSYIRSNRYTYKIGQKLKIFKADSYNMYGYVKFDKNNIKKFCIDSADAPYLFHSKDLDNVDCYFKMQCPIDLDKDGFALTDKVIVPWLDHLHVEEKKSVFIAKAKGERRRCNNFKKNLHKIKPLMIGARRLSDGISYHQLKKGYENYLKDRNINKTKKVMCYFGDTKGPVATKNVIKPDYDSESDIMGFYAQEFSHPNEKRARVAEIVGSFGNDYDARVIRNGNSDSNQQKNKDLIIPLKDFCEHISKFQYNCNVSGYRLSIPNRFIESFIVGTGIITDKLSVKWYLPFDKYEVIETVKMGYYKIDSIDWEKFTEDVKNIKTSNPQKVVSCFEEKWKPIKVAEYMLNEIYNA